MYILKIKRKFLSNSMLAALIIIHLSPHSTISTFFLEQLFLNKLTEPGREEQLIIMKE